MLRFRNRFKGTPSDLHTCKCGQRMTRSVADGRETLIHELPWCDLFADLVATLEGDPSVSMHVALASQVETVVIADGDSAGDVRDGPS